MCVIPFYPFTELDIEIEKIKSECYEYPHHFLSLFTLQCEGQEEKLIFCYVELFSTFQWYVLLSDNYTENQISEVYAQPVLFKEFQETDLDYKQGKYYYDLLKYGGYDKLTWDDFNGMDYEEQKRKVNHVMERTRYDFYYENYLDAIFTPITHNFFLNKNDKSLNLGFNIKDLYLNEYDDEGELISESVNVKQYRIFYEDNLPRREKKFYVFESYRQMKDKEFLEKLKIYNHTKFFQLLDFIQNKTKNPL
ncbi:hypothetical protein ABWED_2352 [Acinetobacter lwoffii]|nr:hypothetical protein ABEKA_3202 [Acinetobacter lwoffii]UVB01607.1 hypothetical protein ABWED_2352 [Acinetobacter lwoffii]